MIEQSPSAAYKSAHPALQKGTIMSATLLTPYAAAKIVNGILADLNEAEGTDLKAIPPQMVYNYVRKGYIPSYDGKVSSNDLMVWLAKYLSRKGVELTATSTEDVEPTVSE